MSKDNKGFHKVFFAGFILPLGLFGFSWGKIQLARDGKSDYAIIQGASPFEAEQFAVRELGDYLEKVTGVRLPILNETNISGDIHGIYVGGTEFASRNGLDAGKLGREEWIIHTVGKNLVLTGGRPVGTLYAVYEFLEKTVGCHWLDRDTEIIPRAPNLAISKLNIRDQPVFWYRYISPGSAIYSPDPAVPGLQEKEGLFRERNKSTGWLARFGRVTYGSPGEQHTFYDYSNGFPTNHPEYWSMNKKGQRVRAKDQSGPEQFCLTNPEVRKLVLKQLKQFIVKDRTQAARTGQPAPWVYDISQNDNDAGYLCFCPNCKILAEKEESNSAPLIEFINDIADGIRIDYPDVLIMTFAYSGTLRPPKTLKPRDNVIIRLAQISVERTNKEPEHYPDFFKPLQHPVNRIPFEDLYGWSQVAKHLAYWDYWVLYCDRFPTPYITMACMQSDLQLFRKCHVENVFVECEFPVTTSFSALKMWVGYKLMQNTDQPVDELIRIFMEGYYGPAASKMKEYLDYLEERIVTTPADVKLSSIPENQRPYFDLNFFITAQRLLTEAEQACGSSSNALLHVRHEWVPLDSTLNNLWTRLEQTLPKGARLPFDREAMIRRYTENYLAQWKAFYSGAIPGKIQKVIDKKLRRNRELPDVERRSAEAPPCLRVPKIRETNSVSPEGDPRKVDWTQAATAGQWHKVTGYTTDRKPVVRLIHDANYLYIQLEEPCDVSKLTQASSIYDGDDWEIFLSAQRDQLPYRQIAVGPDGTKTMIIWWEVKKGGSTWKDDVKVISDKANGHWTVSLAVPLDKVLSGNIKAETKLFANFFRGTPTLDGIETLENLVRADSNDPLAWSPTFESGFHVPSRFGELTLE